MMDSMLVLVDIFKLTHQPKLTYQPVTREVTMGNVAGSILVKVDIEVQSTIEDEVDFVLDLILKDSVINRGSDQ